MTTVRVDILATDNGSIGKLNKETVQLKNNLDGAKKSAAGIRTASQTAAVKGAKSQIEESTEYRVARGARGTGAEGRDFARQAQGLGGLVHVYATFAANLFAVSAAFNALSKAADYTNMVKGLDQLGAASGRNLGTMAKQMAELSDGAISLKTAMEATAQASAAGLTGSQMERMTKIAKNASQALGRDMTDSLSRLSRGITKVEPELLDEIGIMVRVDKAAADYGRTIGKTAASLTDFERRQAFATAVLAQGEEKFNAINIESNPFNKLLASITDLSLAAGSVLTKTVEPLIRLLAESPTALSAVLATIAATLLNKAIPALTQWRAGLVETANIAAAKAKEIALAHEAFMVNKQANVGDKLVAPLQRQALDSLAKVQTSLAKALPETSKLVKNAFSEGFTITPEDLSKYKGALSKAKNSLESSLDLKSKTTDKDILKVLDKRIKGEQEAVAQLKLANLEAERYLHTQKEINIQQQKTGNLIEKTPGYFSQEASLARKALAAERTAIKANIYSQIGQDTKYTGVEQAWTNLNKSIDENKIKLGTLGTITTRISGGMRILGSGILNVISSLGQVSIAIAMVSAAWAMLDSAMSKNSKELTEYNKGIDTLDESIKGLDRTISLYQKDPLEYLSINAIQARANAINELSNSFSTLIKRFREVKEESNGWDKLKNFYSILWGGDDETKLAKKIGSTISKTLDSMVSGPEKDAAEKTFKQILGLKELSEDKIVKKATALLYTDQLDKIEELSKAEEKLSNKRNNAAAALTAYKDSVKETNKQLQTMMNSFIINDPMAKFGSQLIIQANKMAVAIKQPEEALAVLKNLLEDINQTNLLPQDMQNSLLGMKDKILSLSGQLSVLDSTLVDFQRQKRELENSGEDVKNIPINALDPSNKLFKTIETEQYARVKQFIAQDTARRNALILEVKQTTNLLNEISIAQFKKGAEYIHTAVSQAAEQAGIQVTKAYASIISGPEGSDTIKELRLQEISIQEKMLDAQIALTLSIERNTVAQNSLNLRLEMQKGDLTDPRRFELMKELKLNEERKKVLTGTPQQVAKNIEESKNPQIQDQYSSKMLELIGYSSKKSKLGSDKELVILEESLKKIDLLNAQRKSILGTQLEQVKQDESILDSQIKLSNLYSEDLISKREILASDRYRLELGLQEADMTALILKYHKEISKFGEKSEKGIRATKDFQAQYNILLDKHSQSQLKNIEEINKRELDSISLQLASKKLLLTLDEKALEYELKTIEYLEASGIYNKSKTISKKSEMTLQKELNRFNLESFELTEKINAKGTSKEIKASLQKELDIKTAISEATKTQIKLQAEYEKELIKTEETLRSMEQAGQYTESYFNAVSQDFTNKIDALVDASKSAASAFNEGFINAIDSSIDKFFALLQISTLTLKDMIFFVRNSLSDVFRDTASQILKNAWKSTLKGILPESDQDRATREYVSALDRLIKSLDNLNSTLGGNTLGNNNPRSTDYLNNMDSPYANELKQTSENQKQATGTFWGSVQKLGTSIKDFVTGNGTFASIFGNAIDTFKNMMPSWLTSIYNVIVGAMSFSSGGSGSSGGIFGTILKAAVGTFTGNSFFTPSDIVTGGASDLSQYASMASNYTVSAKGNTFYDAPSLSAHSNTVVTSPTLFAFAKGATGLMGEAGPEAVLPLKRDNQGNLGIRGGGQIENNIDINITIENGQVSQGASQDSSNMAGQLGNAIKAAVTQELLNQSRPGGLLARK